MSPARGMSHPDGGGLTRYTVHKIVDHYEIRDAQTPRVSQLSFDSRDSAEACARLANAIEEATVAYLDRWLAA